ncbi:MAG: ankyrin [Desulfobulbaceae bacterium]|nr:ankyrin [Desulfobulbaceae bacterium]
MCKSTQDKNDKTAGEKICPECNGEKIIKGICTCDMEWRGSNKEDDWEDCQCTPDTTCHLCNGKGVIQS